MIWKSIEHCRQPDSVTDMASFPVWLTGRHKRGNPKVLECFHVCSRVNVLYLRVGLDDWMPYQAIPHLDKVLQRRYLQLEATFLDKCQSDNSNNVVKGLYRTIAFVEILKMLIFKRIQVSTVHNSQMIIWSAGSASNCPPHFTCMLSVCLPQYKWLKMKIYPMVDKVLHKKHIVMFMGRFTDGDIDHKHCGIFQSHNL